MLSRWPRRRHARRRIPPTVPKERVAAAVISDISVFDFCSVCCCGFTILGRYSMIPFIMSVAHRELRALMVVHV
eukprot:IDg15119t1